MNIIVRELGGLQSDKRFAEVTVEYVGLKLDLGVHNIKERIELAEHLKSVVDDLLFKLPVNKNGGCDE